MSEKTTIRGSALKSIAVATGVAAAMFTAACSGSDTRSADGLPSRSVTAAVDDAAGKQAAIDLVESASGPVQFIAPGDELDLAELQGRTIALVTLDLSVPFVQAVVAGFQEAAETAGVQVTIFDAKGSSATASQGVDQAVAAGAAAIVAFGVNFDQVAGSVAGAEAAGIPVIGTMNIDSNSAPEPGSAGSVSVDYYESGRLLSAYAIAETDGPVHAAYQNLPSIATFTAMLQGVQDGFTEFCPQECTLSVDDLTQSDFKKATEGLTSSEIARQPDLNWILTAIDGIAQFTIPAIELAGKQDQIRVGSINAVTANLEFIADGRVQASDVGNNNTWLGWAAMDRALRAASGEPAAMSEVPIKLFDVQTLTGVDITNEDALFDNVDYRARYAALWGK
ncbi:sugar ABC transporter substrate-binding protein [Gordonia sp. NPDC003376]